MLLECKIACTAVYYQDRMIASALSDTLVLSRGDNEIRQTADWNTAVSDPDDLSVRVYFYDLATGVPLCEALAVQ